MKRPGPREKIDPAEDKALSRTEITVPAILTYEADLTEE